MLCDRCIDLMEAFSRASGISYGLLNVLLFVVIGPLSTLSLMTSTIFGIINANRFRKTMIAFFIVGVTLLAMLILPLLFTFAFLPS